jgi:RNA polymerase sigma-70 factor (ECF subfamily)
MKHCGGDNEERCLITAILERGDERAFRALYRLHNPRVAMTVLRLVGGDQQLAEDLLQETWLSACRGLSGFRHESSFSTWLTAIALHAARRHFRRCRIELELDDRQLTPVPAADPAARIDLERALARLPDGYRVVLVLHDIEGMRHHEIARAMGLSEGTSKSQLSRARQRLRQLLGSSQEECHATR